MDELFMIGTNDYTQCITVPNYEILEYDQYDEWEDGTGTTRRSIYASKVSGSFTMKFDDSTAFYNFLTVMETHKGSDGAIEATLYLNNKNTTKKSRYFFDFSNLENTVPMFRRLSYSGFRIDVKEQTNANISTS